MISEVPGNRPLSQYAFGLLQALHNAELISAGSHVPKGIVIRMRCHVADSTMSANLICLRAKPVATSVVGASQGFMSKSAPSTWIDQGGTTRCEVLFVHRFHQVHLR
ncbi:hypothetical protein BAUCODRAFT_407072 [Baudoinia panamericana UAMH 10762]|uniref:Uncharacterized protein n=1 Tax=Baudoinia panamericana (strain UAMH 10762) TaxID=717646 RepID=M2MMI0_BAUPA|nr:uncharacterized protein BAUCODRAFT_407072 [Baudoinia panamericana UAMH 10762]EMC97901.1 hypothetical protein BAUCODRAFT_407072 [Baudoinia panamericana UAMH 10762]